MISIHATKKDYPLCDFDAIKGRHIDEIKRKGDTPHVDSLDIKTTDEATAILSLTSERIWLSDSRTGEYHDNINGKMFMKWITTKVIPLSACNYPGVQMVPATENSLYHHVRGIPSLASSPRRELSTS